MNILETAKRADEIMASQNIYCHICGNKQYAPFDKLYTVTYEACVFCTDTQEDLERKAENIFAIIEGSF